MIWPFRYKKERRYWLKVFGWYAVTEATVQFIFFFIFNTFTRTEGSNLEYHLLMLLFHCVLIWPIWWVARAVRKQPVAVQVLVNVCFAFVYGYFWFVPVQEVFAVVYKELLDITQPGNTYSGPTIDSNMHYAVLNYQLLKHAFRLSWYYLAGYFYNYQQEERQRVQLVLSNRELQLRLLKWHLNPAFYFKTIGYLKQEAAARPENAGEPILQLAKVMEYVIYEARLPQVEMEKEIQFLSSYIELINQQSKNGSGILFSFTKANRRLLIAPLLLAGIIDSVATDNNSSEGHPEVTIGFIDDSMELRVKKIAEQPAHQLLLDELYNEKYTITFSKTEGYRLTLQLHAA